MKKHFLRSLALLLALALLPRLPAGTVRAEEGSEGEKTTYDEGTGYTFDYEPEEDPDAGTAILDEALPVSTEGSPLLDELGLSTEAAEETVQAQAQTDGKGGGILLAPKNKMPTQLTMDDIQAMNPGATVIDIYTNEGFLSTLVGKYYKEKVLNVEDGVKSIQGMAALLGLGKGCDFFAVYSETNNTGYTFYTYQQRYGGYTLRYATLRVVVDPDGYTAGLSCSFVPNAGTASKEPAITAEQALEIVKKKFAKFNLTYYPEQTVLMAVPYNNIVVNCYIVYTNNPDANPSFDIPYYEHLVTTDGSYLTIMLASTFAAAGGDAVDNSYYFQGMEVKTYTRKVKLLGGTYYNGYYSKNWVDAIESACCVRFDSEFGDDCYLSITSALVNIDLTRNSYSFYTLFDTSGIMAPVDRYDDVFDDLLTCLKSLKFNDAYIEASQRTSYPMAKQSVITDNLAFLANVHTVVYETYAK